MNLISSRKFDSADSWDMEIVLNASKTEITTQEKTVLVSKQGENVRDGYFREPVTGSTLLSHQEKLPISCLFFKKKATQKPELSYCLGTRTRKNIVRTSKRCFVCLKGSHHAKACFSKIKYFKCSEQHQRHSEENGHGSNGSSAANIAGVDDNTNNLLQTAKVKVKNCDNYVNSSRVSFNSFSQLSYITPQLRLKSKIVGIRKISNIRK